jgi:hypothetical protein
MIVYFCSGSVIEYAQATRCALEDQWLVLYAGELVVERLRRDSVYFCCPPTAYPSPVS